MVSLVRLRPDDRWGVIHQYSLDAARKWGVPGVRCSVCGATWSQSGSVYPELDVSSFPGRERLLSGRPVPVADYLSLRNSLRDFLGTEKPLPPGSEFGPLVGTHKGEVGDVTWLNPWTPLLTSKTLGKLRERGVDLRTWRAEISQDGHPLDLREPEASLSIDALPLEPQQREPCQACGRTGLRFQDLRGLTEPREAADFYRARNFPTLVLVSQRLADVLKDIRASNVIFEIPFSGESVRL